MAKRPRNEAADQTQDDATRSRPRGTSAAGNTTGASLGTETAGTETAGMESAATENVASESAASAVPTDGGAAGRAATGAPAPHAGGAFGPLSGLVPRLAIVVAVLASLIAGALWWQYRQFYVELAGSDMRLENALAETRAYARRLEDELAGLGGRIAEGARDVDSIESEVEALPAEIRALERRVEALAGGRLDAREAWMREQAEYYLVLANAELNLARRVGSAIVALESADNVLRELGDPSLGNVRAAIASELQRLRSVELPDLERLVFDLGGLIERLPELPLRDAAPEIYGAPEADGEEEIEPGFGRLWARTKGAVLSIVRIERQEQPVAQALSEAERRLVRRQLELELQIARTAVLDARGDDFRLSLVAADSILNRDFNREAQSVIESRRLLGDMMQIELAPRLPDIGDSLALLRAASGAR